jgi:hypothetical protein
MKPDIESPKRRAAQQLPPSVLPLYTFDNYRDYLLYLIEVRKDVKGLKARLAEAASCQPSYLAQVLTGTASFSIDQLRGVSRYLNLSDTEWDYLRELGIMERAGSQDLRDDCKRRLRELRERANNGERQGASAGSGPQAEDLIWYTSNWLAMVVNTAIQSRAMRTPQAIARKIGVASSQVLEVMKDLEARGFVENTGGEWRTAIKENLYLGRIGYAQAFRNTWYMRGLLRMSQGYKGGCQTGAVFCLKREEFDELRTRVTEEYRKFFSSLPPETDGDVVAFYAVDLFEV